MAQILFITTNSIRAAIGVTDAELKDDVIVDLMVEDQLLLFLAKQYPGYQALVDANKPGASPAPTTQQQDDFRTLKLVCMYAAATVALQAGQNLLAQQIQSGGVTTSRFAKDDIVTTISRMEGMRDYYLGVLNGTDDLTSYFVPALILSHPDYDPVSGF